MDERFAGGLEQLPRSLFGYRRGVIDRLISDRDAAERQAAGRVRAAEERIRELEGELDATRGELAGVTRQLEIQRADTAAGAKRLQALSQELERMRADAATRQPVPALAASLVGDELSTILAAAQDAAAKVMERAHAEADTELRDARDAWEAVQSELARYSAWQREAGPVIAAAKTHVEDVRERVRDIPERIQQAMAALGEAAAAMRENVEGLAEIPLPPSLTPPPALRPPEAPALEEPISHGTDDEPRVDVSDLSPQEWVPSLEQTPRPARAGRRRGRALAPVPDEPVVEPDRADPVVDIG